ITAVMMRSSIGCSLGGAPRSRALLHAPMAQSAEAADLKSAQSGFESRWGHARRDPARGPPSATMDPMTSSADDTALPPERREQLAARLDDVLARIDTAAARVGRDGRGITVLLATKMRTPAEIAVAVELLRERDRRSAVGEHRAQENAKHAAALPADNGRGIPGRVAPRLRPPGELAGAVELLRERARRIAVGETRPQEIPKHADALLGDNGVPRHFIGRLQTNKARDVVAFAGTIHSV